MNKDTLISILTLVVTIAILVILVQYTRSKVELSDTNAYIENIVQTSGLKKIDCEVCRTGCRNTGNPEVCAFCKENGCSGN
ncbi:MAG: hypothetical protein AAB590_01160 [Patescibacteria group bacterium]